MRNLTKLFRTLSDETRLRIFNLLLTRECCVCEVVQALGISQASASRSLAQIYDCGIIEKRIEGLWTIYSLSPELSPNYNGLIIEAVKLGLSQDQTAADDRRRLAESKRLCPCPAMSKPAQSIQPLGLVNG